MKKGSFLGVLFVAALVLAGVATAYTVTIRPDGQGYYSAWTNSGCSSGSSEWQCVDETPANTSDNLYTSSASVYETFSFGSTGLTDEVINSVTLYFYGQRYSTSRYKFQPVIRASSTNYLGSVKSLTSSYAYYSQAYATNPATGNAWTVSEADALEAGMKSYTSSYGGRIAQVYAVVDYSYLNPDSCLDTDGGFATTVAGSVSGYYTGSYYGYSDYCVDGTTLKEYYCSGNYAYGSNFGCANVSMVCSAGKCV